MFFVSLAVSPFIAAYYSPQAQADRFVLLVIWAILGVLITAQLVYQNRGKFQFNTSCKVLMMSVYVCVANIVVLATDPWTLSIDDTLFILPIYISSFGCIYLTYTLTAFKWVKLFNIFGHKSTFFRLRRPLIGAVILFNILLVLGSFVSDFFGFLVYVEIVVVFFILITPFQIAVFVIYGFKVTRKLSQGAALTVSKEMRWAQVRMFVLTIVSIALWFFAFIFSVIVVVTGNGEDPQHERAILIVVSVFCIFGVTSICATYVFAYFTRHLLGDSSHGSSSENTSEASHHRASSTMDSNRKPSNTTSSVTDLEAVVAIPMAPASQAQEYKIGDLSVEL